MELLESLKDKCQVEVKKKFHELSLRTQTVKWSNHSLAELDADGLSTEDIKNSIDSLELIEMFWTYGFKSPKFVFHLNVPGKPHTHIVVLYNDEYVLVKTAYLATDSEKFEADGKTRVRNFDN
ncbi:DUF4258 domain-containing protein [Paradesulfitobacterium ferrireducens]|uniref:DUF4258 domain-containing protein n=1 Tax=Paradesulfitobacterium ferrireducens TaxID=2816476 RepID=UPI001A8E6129|nr:DUF4258 domain-containing protein [Paradesulfitobacterium ferrireducens]